MGGERRSPASAMPRTIRRPIMTTRRNFIAGAAAAVAASTQISSAADDAASSATAPHRPNPIGLASYSLWQFRHNELRALERNLELAAEWGFAGLEVLHRQM